MKLVQYYAQWIPVFAEWMKPLVKQLHDNPPDLLGWVLESPEAFEQLRLTIASSQL